MDQSDSKSCEIPNDAENLYSHEKLGKIEDLSDSNKKITDEKKVLEKQGHLSGQETSDREAESSHEKENYPNYDHISASGCSGVDTDKLKPQSPIVSSSTSRNLVIERQMCEKEVSAEGGTSVVTSCSNDNASSTLQKCLSTDRNPKDGEVSVRSLEGTDFTQQISAKSDISSETGPLRSGESNDLQNKTESSSSNSIHAMLPVSSSNGFFCTDFKSSMAVQITQKALQNIRARDGNNLSRMIREENCLIVEKADISKFSLSKQKNDELLSQHEEASISSCIIEERNGETAHLCSVESENLNKSICAIENRATMKLHDGKDNCDGFRSDADVVDRVNSQDLAGRFDLNEDFLGNEVECNKNSVGGVTTVSIPVPMVAKSGFYMGLHMTPLKFEGEVGWKGSAATSAFKCISKKYPQGLTGFDLNIAAASEDDFTTTAVPFRSKRAQGLNIDLNSLSESDDLSLSRSCKVDFDLNDNPSHGDTCNDSFKNKALEKTVVREPDFSYMRAAYWGELNSMQGFNHGHARPNGLEPKFPYTQQTLPSYSYPYYNMYPSGVVPCITDPHILASPHFMYAERERDTMNVTRHLNVNSGEKSSENESGVSNTRQFIFPARNFIMEGQFRDFQQVSLAATPMKRKEPEGGWDAYQFGYRQVPNEYRMH